MAYFMHKMAGPLWPRDPGAGGGTDGSWPGLRLAI